MIRPGRARSGKTVKWDSNVGHETDSGRTKTDHQSTAPLAGQGTESASVHGSRTVAGRGQNPGHSRVTGAKGSLKSGQQEKKSHQVGEKSAGDQMFQEQPQGETDTTNQASARDAKSKTVSKKDSTGEQKNSGENAKRPIIPQPSPRDEPTRIQSLPAANNPAVSVSWGDLNEDGGASGRGAEAASSSSRDPRMATLVRRESEPHLQKVDRLLFGNAVTHHASTKLMAFLMDPDRPEGGRGSAEDGAERDPQAEGKLGVVEGRVERGDQVTDVGERRAKRGDQVTDVGERRAERGDQVTDASPRVFQRDMFLFSPTEDIEIVDGSDDNDENNDDDGGDDGDNPSLRSMSENELAFDRDSISSAGTGPTVGRRRDTPHGLPNDPPRMEGRGHQAGNKQQTPGSKDTAVSTTGHGSPTKLESFPKVMYARSQAPGNDFSGSLTDGVKGSVGGRREKEGDSNTVNTTRRVSLVDRQIQTTTPPVDRGVQTVTPTPMSLPLIVPPTRSRLAPAGELSRSVGVPSGDGERGVQETVTGTGNGQLSTSAIDSRGQAGIDLGPRHNGGPTAGTDQLDNAGPHGSQPPDRPSLPPAPHLTSDLNTARSINAAVEQPFPRSEAARQISGSERKAGGVTATTTTGSNPATTTTTAVEFRDYTQPESAPEISTNEPVLPGSGDETTGNGGVGATFASVAQHTGTSYAAAASYTGTHIAAAKEDFSPQRQRKTGRAIGEETESGTDTTRIDCKTETQQTPPVESSAHKAGHPAPRKTDRAAPKGGQPGPERTQVASPTSSSGDSSGGGRWAAQGKGPASRKAALSDSWGKPSLQPHGTHGRRSLEERRSVDRGADNHSGRGNQGLPAVKQRSVSFSHRRSDYAKPAAPPQPPPTNTAATAGAKSFSNAMNQRGQEGKWTQPFWGNYQHGDGSASDMKTRLEPPNTQHGGPERKISGGSVGGGGGGSSSRKGTPHSKFLRETTPVWQHHQECLSDNVDARPRQRHSNEFDNDNRHQSMHPGDAASAGLDYDDHADNAGGDDALMRQSLRELSAKIQLQRLESEFAARRRSLTRNTGNNNKDNQGSSDHHPHQQHPSQPARSRLPGPVASRSRGEKKRSNAGQIHRDDDEEEDLDALVNFSDHDRVEMDVGERKRSKDSVRSQNQSERDAARGTRPDEDVGDGDGYGELDWEDGLEDVDIEEEYAGGDTYVFYLQTEDGAVVGPLRFDVDDVDIGLPVTSPARSDVARQQSDNADDGLRNRQTGSHGLNEFSSRSHSVLTVTIDSETQPDTEDENLYVTKRGKLSFVDLAGSEKVKDASGGFGGPGMLESNSINKSLLVLGNCISHLGDAKRRHGHIPYRDSKLTKLLSDSLGGNGITLMIACITPSSSNTTETMNTLRYASRAKKIKSKPTVKMDPREKLILNLKREIKVLRNENHYLRQQLDFPAKPKGQLQKENDEKFMKFMKEQKEKESGLYEMLQEYMVENENLRAENSEMHSMRDRIRREQQLLYRENEKLMKRVEEMERVMSQNPGIWAQRHHRTDGYGQYDLTSPRNSPVAPGYHSGHKHTSPPNSRGKGPSGPMKPPHRLPDPVMRPAQRPVETLENGAGYAAVNNGYSSPRAGPRQMSPSRQPERRASQASTTDAIHNMNEQLKREVMQLEGQIRHHHYVQDRSTDVSRSNGHSVR